MHRSFEQRMAIKFCVKLEKSAAETIPMLKKAFGVDCLSDWQIFRWHKAFAEGREDVNDDSRAGRPSTSSSDDNTKIFGPKKPPKICRPVGCPVNLLLIKITMLSNANWCQ
ncbi:hypothetical protein NQ318_017105 [Aromia moschata]|uniref:Mos1 transposase HTH domain-containing protein n=1 Tax=Aromia moschata TaxID=1265417 RepID=A0AAV8Y3G6_9CUCU|nr:hypothetical protein NQ318_017105 [Aromia moschata]